MSQKGWILLAGIAFYLVWRNQAMSSATSVSGAGNGAPATTTTAVSPGNTGTGNWFGLTTVSPINVSGGY